MPYVLRDLELKRAELFSVVDKGAGGDDDHRPRIVLIKRRKEQGTMTLNEKIQKALDELRAELAKEEPMVTDPKALLELALEGMPDDKKAAIMSAVAAMQQAPPPVAPVAPKADEPPKPPEGPGTAPNPPGEPAKIDDEDKKPEDMEKLMKDLPKEAREAIEKIAKDAEAVAKASTEEIAKLKKANEDTLKRLDETEDVVALQKAKEEHAGMVEVAKAFPLLQGDYDERATMLLKVRKSDPEGYEALLETLKSAHELAKRGHGEAGTTRAALDGDTSEAKIETLAKARATEMMKDKKMSKGKAYGLAYAEVIKANPDLRRAAQDEQQ